jgi:hypothetical protein
MEAGAIDQLFQAYLASVRAAVLGSDPPPDEDLMRSIEVEMDVAEERAVTFRRSLITYVGALAIDGKIFDARTNPRLLAALHKVLDPDGSAEPLAERGLRLLREGAARIGSITVTATGTSGPADNDATLIEARRCLEQAIADGDLRATLPLASMLREGLGGAADAVRARSLYTEVHDRSQDPRAALALALMTAHGEGGPQDPRRGYELLRPIAATGDLRAVAALLDLAETPDEVAEAERFAQAAKDALARAMS